MRMLKRALLLLALGLSAFASITVKTIADVSGDGSAHALSTVTGTGNVLWVQLLAPSGNASVVRWGDSNISSTRGGTIAAGGGQLIPLVPLDHFQTNDRTYSLAQLYYLVQSGDKLTIIWAQ